MSARDDFQRQMDLKMKEWGAEIEKLRAQAKGDRVGVAAAEVKSTYYEQIEQLESTRRALQDRIEALRTLAQDQQAVARAEVERAAATFKRDLDAAIARHRYGPRQTADRG
jgi:hypothetical protein